MIAFVIVVVLFLMLIIGAVYYYLCRCRNNKPVESKESNSGPEESDSSLEEIIKLYEDQFKPDLDQNDSGAPSTWSLATSRSQSSIGFGVLGIFTLFNKHNRSNSLRNI